MKKTKNKIEDTDEKLIDNELQNEIMKCLEDEYMTISELQNSSNYFMEYSEEKISAFVGQLVKEKKVGIYFVSDEPIFTTEKEFSEQMREKKESEESNEKNSGKSIVLLTLLFVFLLIAVLKPEIIVLIIVIIFVIGVLFFIPYSFFTH